MEVPFFMAGVTPGPDNWHSPDLDYEAALNSFGSGGPDKQG